MCAIPARVAGVERVALASPPGPDGDLHPIVLAAAAICEVDEVYAMGGAQAIFALAYGTESVAPVDVIAGPGNAWVQEAKRAVARSGRDRLLRRPVGADGDRRPRRRPRVDRARSLRAGRARRREPAARRRGRGAGARGDREAPWTRRRRSRPTVTDAPLALVQVPDAEAAIDLANAYAPEHLELRRGGRGAARRPGRHRRLRLRRPHAATAFGDYAAGSNHVLPTGGAGRFSGPLGPGTSAAGSRPWRCRPTRRRSWRRTSTPIARAEGFPVHGESAMIRSRP